MTSSPCSVDIMKITREPAIFTPISIILETKEDYNRFRKMVDFAATNSRCESIEEEVAFQIQRTLNDLENK